MLRSRGVETEGYRVGQVVRPRRATTRHKIGEHGSMKVTMVGQSGSGKTTYMAALHEMLGANRVADSFYITPRASSFEEGIAEEGRFDDVSFGKRNFQFPDGTQQTTLWTFDFFHKERLVCGFEWIDYRGGIVNELFSQDEDERTTEDRQELLGHFRLSSAVLLFADAITLTHYENSRQRRIQSGARAINNLIRQYSMHYPDRPLTVVIVLTKADSDLIDPEWKDDNYAKLTDVGIDAFNEVAAVVRSGRNEGWAGGIVAVGSVGEGAVQSQLTPPDHFANPPTVKTQIVGFPEPVNAYHPLFFALGRELDVARAVQARKVRYSEMEINSILKGSGRLKDFWSWASGKEGIKDIAEEMATKKLEEQAALEAIASNIDPMFRHTRSVVREL